MVVECYWCRRVCVYFVASNSGVGVCYGFGGVSVYCGGSRDKVCVYYGGRCDGRCVYCVGR